MALKLELNSTKGFIWSRSGEAFTQRQQHVLVQRVPRAETKGAGGKASEVDTQ